MKRSCKRIKQIHNLWIFLYVVFLSYSHLAETFAYMTFPRPIGLISNIGMFSITLAPDMLSTTTFLALVVLLFIQILLIFPLFPDGKIKRIFTGLCLLVALGDGVFSVQSLFTSKNGLDLLFIGYILMDLVLILFCGFCLWCEKKLRDCDRQKTFAEKETDTSAVSDTDIKN